MNTLDRILENKRTEIDSLAVIGVSELSPSRRSFCAAVDAEGLSIIAEVKRRSPSGGALCDALDPVACAKRYVDGGARAISVLVDAEFFGGSWEDLSAVARSVEIPVLCKEFIIDTRQIHHARRAGADACLLIVAALDDTQLGRLMRETASLGMDALVEVHNEAELERAIGMDAEIIGINNRNLSTLKIDLGTVERLAPMVPSDCTIVAESGYQTADDLSRLPDTVNALLVGTALLRSDSPTETLRAWINRADQRRTTHG